jgi:hypothetical protein
MTVYLHIYLGTWLLRLVLVKLIALTPFSKKQEKDFALCL